MPTVNANTIIAYARKIMGNLNVYDLTDADALLFLNEAFNEAQMDLVNIRADFFVEKSIFNSISNNQSVIQMPLDCLLVKRIEVNFTDPTNVDYFKKCTEFDAANAPKSWDWYLKNQPKSEPMVDLRGEFAEIAPKADADYNNAIKIIYISKSEIYDANGDKVSNQRFSATTDLIPYPFSLYPEVLAYKMAEVITYTLGNTSTIQNKALGYERLYDKKMKKLVSGIETDLEVIVSKSVPIDTRSF